MLITSQFSAGNPSATSLNLQTEVQCHLHGMTEGTITQGYAIWSGFGKQSPQMTPESQCLVVIGDQDFV